MTLIEIELSGFDAYRDGKHRCDAPHPIGSPQDAAWQSGWFTAYTIAMYRLRPWPRDDARPPTYH